MNITLEDIARFRAIAEADMNGADGKAWDEAITPKVVIALCDKVEQLSKVGARLSARSFLDNTPTLCFSLTGA